MKVEVRPRKFETQHLHLSAAQESRYEAPETKREYELIGRALDLETPEALWQGNFLMPVKGRTSTSYGMQRYVNGHFSYRHRGMDIAAPEGTPVRAAADGVVALADDSFQLHGHTIVLDHGHAVETIYLHLSKIDVKPGDHVTRGQQIGRVGKTGVATGPHLHYGVYVHHEAMDPTSWTHLAGRVIRRGSKNRAGEAEASPAGEKRYGRRTSRIVLLTTSSLRPSSAAFFGAAFFGAALAAFFFAGTFVPPFHSRRAFAVLDFGDALINGLPPLWPDITCSYVIPHALCHNNSKIYIGIARHSQIFFRASRASPAR